MPHSKPQTNAEPIAGYKLRRYLGRGGFGEVWEAEAPGGLSKAVKIAPVESDADGISCRELEGLTKIRDVRHPYLLSIERFEIIDGYLIIVMELADRSLADRFNECIAQGMAGIPRVELLHYLTEAAEVFDLLNERHGLQHLDVKPENLFLCGDHVKVADFGLVQPRNTLLHRSAIAISPPYAPPELFDGKSSKRPTSTVLRSLIRNFSPAPGPMPAMTCEASCFSIFADVRTFRLFHPEIVPL